MLRKPSAKALLHCAKPDFIQEQSYRVNAGADFMAQKLPAVMTPSNGTGSGTVVSSRTEGGSHESNMLTDELGSE